MATKRQLGQYYTVSNPFKHPLFYSWLDLIPEEVKDTRWLEPFCGSNNVPELLAALGIKPADDLSWGAYDINPPGSHAANISITQQDTLTSFPGGYSVCITNPPYLAKNSAKRRGLPYPAVATYDNLYKYSIFKCLENTQYLAAIIPQSFINTKRAELKSRLYGIITLDMQMFDDTDFPVCLALFQDKPASDFFISESSSSQIVKYSSFLAHKLTTDVELELTFQAKHGELGLKAVDNTAGPSIAFCRGDTFPSSTVGTSRTFTRIGSASFKDIDDFDVFIDSLNLYLSDWRYKTGDIFLSAFKGLRKDAKYRRRLDWATAANLIKVVYADLNLQ